MKHDQVPGVFAHIDVDGFRLEEFEEEQEDEQPDTLTTTRYVEAIAGANFTVRVSFSHDFPYLRDDILCRLWLDGKDVSGRIALKGRFDVPQFEGVTEHTKSGSYLRRFQFSDLVTSDEPVKGDMKKELKDLGTITLKLTRCVSSPSTRKEPTSDRSAFKPVGEDGVPEKSLKGRAISSRASLGAMEKAKPTNYYHTDFPYGKEPFAEFTFKYRSHKDLQIEGIISRTPSPEPLENRDPATLNADELRELLARRNQEIQDLAHIKREKRERSTTLIDDDDNAGDDELAITGRSSKRHRTSQDSGVEVVDLTDD